jgi:four helix bundle protein
MQLVELVYKLSGDFPSDEKYGLKSQIQRASVSIPANIAEGWGRGYSQNFIQFLNIASGSLAELETLIILAQKLEFSKSDSGLLKLCGEISKMLYSLKRSIKEKQMN